MYKMITPRKLPQTEIGEKIFLAETLALFAAIKAENAQQKKAELSYCIFDWIARNTWILEQGEIFGLDSCVKDKLRAWQNEPAAKRIIEDFGWLMDNDPPYGTRSRRGRRIHHSNYN